MPHSTGFQLSSITRLALHWQILIAIVLASVAGVLTHTDTTWLSFNLYEFYAFLGELFLHALQMIVVPLVMSSVIVGIANIGSRGNLARIGGKTILFYAASSLFAIIVGLLLVNIIQPGVIDGQPAAVSLQLEKQPQTDDPELAGIITHAKQQAGGLTDLLIRMIPTNIVAAAAEGQLLGLIFFSLVFGFFISRLDKSKGQGRVLLDFWQDIFDVIMQVTLWVMKFAPLGVFGLVAHTVTVTGFSAFLPLLELVLVVVIGLAVHVLITMSLLLRYIGKVSPFTFIRSLFPVMLMAFSTSSSSATLPLTMEVLEKDVKVSNDVTSFVLPLGATLNMDGTALYECVAAIFIAQLYGIDLSIMQQITLVFTALLASMGVAGVPMAGTVAIVIVLTVLGLPLEGIGLLMVTDRVLDMLRTLTNVYGDACAATVIARTEGEKTSVALKT